MAIPTRADVGKIMAAADVRFQPFIGVCAFAGLRLGEAAAVKVDDTDFLRRTLTVSRQVQRAGKDRVEIRGPKYGSERVVYLPEDLVNMLAAHVEGGVRPEAGCSSACMTARHIRTRSATGGERRCETTG